MHFMKLKPSITDYSKLNQLVQHLRHEGVCDTKMPQRISEIGAVDLDMLAIVMQEN